MLFWIFMNFFFPYFSPPQSKSWLSLYSWFISTNSSTCSSSSSSSTSFFTVNWCNILGLANQESRQVEQEFRKFSIFSVLSSIGCLFCLSKPTTNLCCLSLSLSLFWSIYHIVQVGESGFWERKPLLILLSLLKFFFLIIFKKIKRRKA